jgi:TolB-like protein/Tfp pilus assembly protein PilF
MPKVMLVVAGLGWLAAAGPVRAQCPDGTPPPCAARPARTATAPTSVAVLYFDNLSRDTADAYLADGLTEQTIAQLGMVARLTVTSRYAVRRFRGEAAQDPAAVGRALSVSHLVSGSIQRSGGRLRVNVELVRAATGVRVWGEQYDRTDTDLLQIQDDIATAVATGIVGRLLPAERRGVAARTTRDPVAYDHFLRGNYFLARRGASSMNAIREFEAAVAADPSFTDAVARIAYCYANILDNETDVGLSRDTLIARGTATAARAVRLDSLSSDAWMAQAYIRMAQYPRTLEGARERFERAIALNPRSAEAHHQYAWLLTFLGDTAGARAENLRALAIEPGRAITVQQLMALALASWQPEEALRLSDSILALDPAFGAVRVWRFMVFVGQGDTASSRREAQVMATLPGRQALAATFLAFLSVPREDTAAVRRFRETLLAVPVSPTAPGTTVAAGFGAMMLAQLGDRDGALRVLEAAWPRGAWLYYMLRLHPLDPLRGDPRFWRLLDESRPPGAAW